MILINFIYQDVFFFIRNDFLSAHDDVSLYFHFFLVTTILLFTIHHFILSFIKIYFKNIYLIIINNFINRFIILLKFNYSDLLILINFFTIQCFTNLINHLYFLYLFLKLLFLFYLLLIIYFYIILSLSHFVCLFRINLYDLISILFLFIVSFYDFLIILFIFIIRFLNFIFFYYIIHYNVYFILVCKDQYLCSIFLLCL